MRSLPEWIGKSDDASVPDRVRLRVFFRFGGRCQCGCGRLIYPGEAWDVDHVKALILGGEHRETNFQPLLRDHHRAKSKRDQRAKSKTYKKRLYNHGVKKARKITRWRRFDGTIVKAPTQR